MAPTNNSPAITFLGNPITVKGTTLKIGDKLPELKLTGQDMSDLSISSLIGKPLLVLALPSLDTPVCSLETKNFANELSKLGDRVNGLAVSRDLPFAQKRWCAAEGATNIVTGSDYKYRTFGEAYGTLWDGAELLVRAVFVAGPSGEITYVEYVPEISQEPNYAGALDALAQLTG
jgi:thiol peroxidase